MRELLDVAVFVGLKVVGDLLAADGFHGVTGGASCGVGDDAVAGTEGGKCEGKKMRTHFALQKV